MSKILQYDNTNGLISISWQLTLKCNYNCKYCSQVIEKKIFSMYPQKYIEELAFKLKENILKNKINVRIHFTGGEPTLYDLKKIISILDNEYIKNYSITTNLSQSIQYYFLLTKFYKKINITASLHETECDYNKFIEKANLIPNLKVNLTLTKENEKIINEIATKLRCPYTIRPEYNSSYNLEVDASKCKNKLNSNIKIIDELGNEENFNSQSDVWKKYGGLNFNNYKCFREYFKIKPNGDVYNGSCKFIISNPPIGNILKDDIKFLPKEEICHSDVNCNLCGKIKVTY